VEEVIIIININRFGSLVYLDPLAARCLLPVGIAIKIRERIRCKSDLEFLPAVALPSHISGVSDHTQSEVASFRAQRSTSITYSQKQKS
jgi:hypothetical protein